MAKQIPLDPDRVRETLNYFEAVVRPDLHATDLLELRAFRPGYRTACGLFRDLTAATTNALRLSDAGYAVYSLLNPVDPASDYAKKNEPSRDKVNFRAQASASAAAISRRRLYLFDFDPPRPADTCSTDAEKAAVHQEAHELFGFLYGQGWPDPITLDSGNGYHQVYLAADDSPVDQTACDLFKGILRALKVRFPSLDCSVYDAPRLHRVPGTVNSKGTDSVERPHREAYVLDLPDPLEPVTMEMLLALEFALDPLSAFRRSNPRKSKPRPALAIDEEGVEAFIDQYRDILQLDRIYRKAGVSYFVLNPCPFKGSQHINQGDKSCIFLSETNICFKCFSSDCEDRRFRDLLELLHDETGEWPKVRFRVGMDDDRLSAIGGGVDDLTPRCSPDAAD